MYGIKPTYQDGKSFTIFIFNKQTVITSPSFLKYFVSDIEANGEYWHESTANHKIFLTLGSEEIAQCYL